MKKGLFEHSGEMNASAPLQFLVGGGIGGFVIAFVVTFLGNLIPLVIMHLLLLVSYVYAIGFMNQFLIEKTHLRHPKLAGWLGLSVGAMTWYFSWVALFYFGLEDGVMYFDPRELWALAKLVAAEGYWEFEDTTMGATVTWTLWALEVLIVVGGAGHMAKTHVYATAYCEKCARWLRPTATYGPFAPAADERTFRHGLEDGEVEPLFDLNVAETSPFWMLDTVACNHCQKFHLGKLVEVTLGEDNKTKRDDLTGMFHLSAKDVNRLEKISTQFQREAEQEAQ